MSDKKHPFTMSLADWKKHRENEEKEHPIATFISDKWRSIMRCAHNTKWFFKHRITHRYHVVKTGLPPGWFDTDTRLLYVSFNMLKDFVEIEEPSNRIDWDFDEVHKNAWKEIKGLYDWWTITRPNRVNPLDKIEPKTDVWREDQEYVQALRDAAQKENEWYEEDTENLIRLMKIRKYLWT